VSGSTETINFTSRAKVNWYLAVGPARPDGYHDIVTVFQELSIGEPISFHRETSPLCVLEGYPENIPSESNLVTKAWALMRAEYPDRVMGLVAKVDKQLPQGGGLGGGSSNAACAIKAINQLYHLDLTVPKLEELAGKIGSDVAFFIRGGTALGTGRGQILQQFDPAPPYWFVILVPSEPMSTAEGYRLLDTRPHVAPLPHTLSDFKTALYSGDPLQIARNYRNDFEFVAEKFKWFTDHKEKLLDAGVLHCVLCGSGSTVAGLVRDQKHAEEVAAKTNGIITCTSF